MALGELDPEEVKALKVAALGERRKAEAKAREEATAAEAAQEAATVAAAEVEAAEAEAGEGELRRLGLGFRAPYVARAAKAVLDGQLDLAVLVRMPYPEAKAALMEIKGIGSKIADCIAVFSLEKLEAFPIDVWVRRALSEWYFPGQKTPPDRVLLEWAQEHFGRYGGYAQQYLFHGRRRQKADS